MYKSLTGVHIFRNRTRPRRTWTQTKRTRTTDLDSTLVDSTTSLPDASAIIVNALSLLLLLLLGGGRVLNKSALGLSQAVSGHCWDAAC